MKYILTIIIGCYSVTVASHAQTPITQFGLGPQTKDWSWVNRPWSGDSTPYLRLKNHIDTAFKNVKQIEPVTQKYRKAALAKPGDPLAQYAWGYAAYGGRPSGTSIDGNELPNIVAALSNCADPKAYEYNRLRFIATANWRPYLQLKPLGKRLLDRSPQDYRVKRSMISLLAVSSKAEQQQGLIYAQQLVRNYPQKSGAYSSLGWVYTMMSTQKNHLALGDKAIYYYRKSIALSNDPVTRRSIQQTIDTILSERKRRRKMGEK